MIFLLPVLTGLLLVFSFPRADQGYVAWVAYIPEIYFLLRARTVKTALAGGFIAGLIQFFSLLVWMPAVLTRYGGLPALLAWLAYVLLIALLACYPAAACAVTKYLILRRGDAFILLFPFIWVLFEYANSLSPFGGLPWLLAGYSQSRYLPIIQIADIVGVYGISFLILWTGTAAVWLVRNKGRGLAARVSAAAALALIAGSLVYGAASLRQWAGRSPRYRAAMLQANISLDDPEPLLLDKFQAGYVRMTDRLAKGTDLLLLPESPSPLSFDTDPTYRHAMQGLAGRFPLGLIFNNVAERGSGESLRYFNSAYFLDGRGVVTGVYDKIHLVPFGEYIPLKEFFSFIETISKDVGAFDAGTDYRIVNIGGHPSNAVICFEAVFPSLVRRFVHQGSELIVNLTNDGWYGDSAAPHQHLAITRFRAVENRRYLLRATNSGISAFIEPSGNIPVSTHILQEAVCEGRFDFLASATFYTRYGDVFVFLCAIISCGSAICAVLGSAGKER